MQKYAMDAKNALKSTVEANVDETERLTKIVEEREKDFWATKTDLASILEENGDFEQAVEIFQKALEWRSKVRLSNLTSMIRHAL